MNCIIKAWKKINFFGIVFFFSLLRIKYEKIGGNYLATCIQTSDEIITLACNFVLVFTIEEFVSPILMSQILLYFLLI